MYFTLNFHHNSVISYILTIASVLLVAILFLIKTRRKNYYTTKNNIAPENPSQQFFINEQEQALSVNYSSDKIIGYVPNNIFMQAELLSYPYVVMPKADSVIEQPKVGRSGRKGYKEDDFRDYMLEYFENDFEILDAHYVSKNERISYEPDLILISRADNVNLFVDIEIDEPYEGTNNKSERKTTHYTNSDTTRNKFFSSNGWLVIRFAEIQIHRNPKACCFFIASVIASLTDDYNIPQSLTAFTFPVPVKQWTKTEGEELSQKNYREEYLDIEEFGKIPIGETKERRKVSSADSFRKPERGMFIGKVSSFRIVKKSVAGNDNIHKESLYFSSVYCYGKFLKVMIREFLLKSVVESNYEEILGGPVEVEYEICIKDITQYKTKYGDIKNHTRTSNRAVSIKLLTEMEYKEYEIFQKRIEDKKLIEDLDISDSEKKRAIELYLSQTFIK